MTTNAQTRDDEYEKAKKMTAMPDEPGKAVLELFAQLEEAKKALKAMTEHSAELYIENMAQRRRINGLLQSNNEFEERARNAERRIKKVIAWLDTLPIGQPLTQDGKPIDHTVLNDLKQGL